MATTIIKSAIDDNQAYVDSTGHLLVTGTFVATSAAEGPTGSTAPTYAIEIGGVDIGGILRALKVDAAGALIVSGSFTATNPSVGLTGAAAPTSATEMGAVDSGGVLRALKVDGSGALIVSGTSVVSGTVDTDLNGLNVFQTSQYTIGATSQKITPTPLPNRSVVSIKVSTTGANVIYIGPTSAVTTADGYPLFNGDTIQMDITGAHDVWLIATAAGQTAYVMEMGK